jgi:iron-sulfur cluster repair protein YtfE (RIC family)
LSFQDLMQQNHKHCDEVFATAEQAVASKDWDGADKAWQQFTHELESHITDKEEGKLFPALEAIHGSIGPIHVMRGEHDHMRSLVAQLNEALAAKDDQQFLGLSETLMMLMQQHNMKEEQILYPMIDSSIPDATALIS